MKYHNQCRVCDWWFWTNDHRKKECCRACADLVSSNTNGDKPMEVAIERAREKHKKLQQQEFIWQKFCLGVDGIIFR